MSSNEQDRFIVTKLNEGLSLSQVQKLLAEELGVKMTYLDLRLLVADLEVNWDKQESEKPAAKPAAELAEESVAQEDGGVPGKTTVTVSKLVRPGAAMSGEVVFSSGAKAEWFLDAMGRLGLNPAPGSERPDEQDLRDFQLELQRKLGAGA